MNDTEELIKDAFEFQAAQAPDHRRVLAAVRAAAGAPARRRGLPRWGGFALAGAAAVAAVAVPVAVLGGGTAVVTPASSSQVQAPVREAGAPLPHRPGWLPDGFAERRRSAEPGGLSWDRSWRGPGDALVTLHRAPKDRLPDGGDFPGEVVPVDVGGKPGVLVEPFNPKSADPGADALVVWQLGPAEQLTVGVERVEGARDVALRIARAVVADPVSAMAAPAEFGWLPEGVRATDVSIEGDSPTGWGASLSTRGAPGEKTVHARLDPKRLPGEVGTPIAVRGARGEFDDWSKEASGLHGVVRVELPDGRWLSVSGPFAAEELVRVADTLVIHPAAPQDWIGRR